MREPRGSKKRYNRRRPAARGPHKRGLDLGYGAAEDAGLWERAATENTVRDSLFAGAHRARRRVCARQCAPGRAEAAAPEVHAPG